MDFEILINHTNLLDKLYVPSDLIATDDNENNFHRFLNPDSKPMISNSIVPYFFQMQEDMIKEGLFIIVDSGYRSYESQRNILEQRIQQIGIDKASKLVAPPELPEHQSGIALDIAIIKNGVYCDDVTENDPEVIWLMENAYKYGFILRYPKGKEEITMYQFEPWHYRYVGTRLSYLLKHFDITLEEYYEKKYYYDELYSDLKEEKHVKK